MAFQSTAGFLQWFVLYKLLAFSYEISLMGQILLEGSVACPAPAQLVGAVVREPFDLPAHISCVGYHSSITVVLHILKYLLFHVVTQHNVVFTSNAFWEWDYSFLDWEWRWKSMNNIPTLQIQSVHRVGIKYKVARKPTLKSALRARPQEVDLSFAGFLEILEKHQGFVHCWSFKPSDMCVWWTNRVPFFTPWANSTSWWGVRVLPPNSLFL